MLATGVDSLNGKVASAVFRWKITWRSPCVSTVSTGDSSANTPLSALSAMARSIEQLHVLGDRVATPLAGSRSVAQRAGVALVAGVGETAALGSLGLGVAVTAGLDHQRLHGLTQDVPGADVVRVTPGREEPGHPSMR